MLVQLWSPEAAGVMEVTGSLAVLVRALAIANQTLGAPKSPISRRPMLTQVTFFCEDAFSNVSRQLDFQWALVMGFQRSVRNG